MIKHQIKSIKDNFMFIKDGLQVLHEQKRIQKNKSKIYSKNLSRELMKLKHTTKIHINMLVSDTRYLNPNRWQRLKFRVQGKNFCRVHIFMPHNQDIDRVYPFYKANILDINGKYYMFTPKAFRYINGLPILFFWANMPYALLVDPNDEHFQPSIDTEAFTSVQNSKFIKDAVSGADTSSTLLIALLVVMIILFIGQVVTVIFMTSLDKRLKEVIGG